jgi:hypothetical protein
MKTIYLCGPINGRSDWDCRNWREYVASKWEGAVLDPMRRDYRGRELEPGIAAEIVAGDLEDIQQSGVIFVYYDKPSVGTAMEIFYAKRELLRPVVLVNGSDAPLSPWLIHHVDKITGNVDEAIEWAARQ